RSPLDLQARPGRPTASAVRGQRARRRAASSGESGSVTIAPARGTEYCTDVPDALVSVSRTAIDSSTAGMLAVHSRPPPDCALPVAVLGLRLSSWAVPICEQLDRKAAVGSWQAWVVITMATWLVANVQSTVALTVPARGMVKLMNPTLLAGTGPE